MADGHPAACVGDAPFAYADAFSAHASIGFFCGAMLEDPAGLLEGAGKRMRHLKLRWGQGVDEAAAGRADRGGVSGYSGAASHSKSLELMRP